MNYHGTVSVIYREATEDIVLSTKLSHLITEVTKREIALLRSDLLLCTADGTREDEAILWPRR
jgi:hypothetical protein